MKDTNNFVSLIIPVYNFENFIVDTLKSAVKQTWKNLEILVIDDGSSDKSAEKILNFAKDYPQIRYIFQENQGVSVARNKGIEEAKGDYICFSDADDILSPEYVEYLVENAIKFNCMISIGTGIYTNYSLGNVSNSKNGDAVYVLSQEEAIIRMLTYWFPIGCYCRAFKKDLFVNGLRFIPGQKVGEGFTFNIKALQMTDKVVVGGKLIYCYRRDNTKSCMTDFKISRAQEAVHSINVIKSLFQTPNLEIAKALEFAEWHTKGDMYNWMVITNNQKNYPKECRDYFQAIKSFSCMALRMKLTQKEKLRALMQSIHPRLIPALQILRKKV